MLPWRRPTIPTVDRVIHADLLGVEVDLDQRFWHRHAPPVGEDLGKPAADGEHDIGVRQRMPSRGPTAHDRARGDCARRSSPSH